MNNLEKIELPKHSAPSCGNATHEESITEDLRCTEGTPARANRETQRLDGTSWYHARINAFHLLTRDEQYALARLAQLGDRSAFDKMIYHNMGLVRGVARAYQYKNPYFDLADLMQEGTIGLMEAVRRFNPDFGFSFSTYAMWWIRETIRHMLKDTGRLVRVPADAGRLINKVRKEMEKVDPKEGPIAKLLAERLEVSEQHIKFALEILAQDTPLSLDTVPVDGDESMYALFPDTSNASPATLATARLRLTEMLGELRAVMQEVRQVVKKDRDVRIFKERFGLTREGVPHTLEHIGKAEGRTRERMRKIVEKTLLKLNKRGLQVDHDTLNRKREDLLYICEVLGLSCNLDL